MSSRDADDTVRKVGKPFLSGDQWNGNANGRPKGSRNRLSENFIAALSDDFDKHGPSVIETVRTEHPKDYLKVIASIVPKEFTVKDQTLEDMSDDELVELLAAVRSLTLAQHRKETGNGVEPKGRNKKAREQLN